MPTEPASSRASRPQPGEAAPYYFRYIDRVEGDAIVPLLAAQMQTCLDFFAGISETASLHRYAPGKWSVRQVLQHLRDCERVFAFRALWFARGLPGALPSFDQDIASPADGADAIPWAQHCEDFHHLRQSTLGLFRNLPPDAWTRGGIASDSFVNVRALAYIIAGHTIHHVEILRERYLPQL